MNTQRMHGISTLAAEAQVRARQLVGRACPVDLQMRLGLIASGLSDVERVLLASHCARSGCDLDTAERWLEFYMVELHRTEDALRAARRES